MQKKRIARAALLILGLGIGWSGLQGCSTGGTETKKTEERPAVAVEVIAVGAADISQGVDVVGTLIPRFEAGVKSEYLGQVSEIHVTQWVRVKKGAPLARLDTREAEAHRQKMLANREGAKANLLEAEAALARAQREDERSRNLKEYGLITRQRLEDAGTEEVAARARVTAARAQLEAAGEDLRQSETRLAKAVIRAPLDGTVAERAVNVGDLVGEAGSQKAMFRIVDNRLLDLVVTVPSHEMEQVSIGQSVTFTTDAIPGRTFSGRVKFINPAVSPADRSVRVEAEVANPAETLKGGLFVRGRIITGERRNALQVPRTALAAWDLKERKGSVWTVENGIARRRTVQTGIMAGDRVEITGGLAAGKEVIIRGGFSVKDGDRIRIVRNGGGT